jgi:hypothetical protein
MEFCARIFPRFSFCEAIITPKTELVNTFLQKNQKNFQILELFLKNLFTKRKNGGIIIPK